MSLKKKKTVKEKTRKLLAIAKGKKRALIFLQDTPDPDALAAAVALARLLKAKRKINSTLTFSGVIGRAENKAMVERLKINVQDFSAVNIDDYDLLALVDAQPGTGNNAFPPDRAPDVVIDHHPLREETKKAAFHDVRENYGATSSILTEYLFEEGVRLSHRLATALAFGIKTDTKNLGRETSVLDIDAYRYVFDRANQRLLGQIEDEKVPQEYFAVLADAMKNATIYEDAIVSGLGEIDNPDMVGEIADLLMRLQHMRSALCYGFYGGQGVFSIRTTEEDLNAGKLARSMLKQSRLLSERGTAGGHDMMAGGQIRLEEKSEEEMERLGREIRNSFLEVIGVEKRARRTLIK
jgi:nanoRNase/pAp phosphatase (c-di-AMP/oligoRNAs hydrolase)